MGSRSRPRPAAKTAGDIATELVAEMPDHPARSLAKILRERCGRAMSIERARGMINYRLGKDGKDKRKWARYPRPDRKPGQLVEMPKSKAEPWTPYVLEVVGRVGILSDIHVPYHSDVALAAAVDYLRGQQLAALVLNGDVADFYTISRWVKNPAMRNLKAELGQVRQLLAWIRQEFPSIPIVYKLGNHEERWTHWLWQHAPEICDEPEMGLRAWFHLDEHGIDLVDDQRPVMAGKLPILHGHELPKGLTNPVNMARGAFLRTLSTILVGHGHRTSGHAESNLWHEEVFCWSQGCLCDMNPEYARVNRWNWGFATVDIHAAGDFDVENLRITADGKVRTS